MILNQLFLFMTAIMVRICSDVISKGYLANRDMGYILCSFLAYTSTMKTNILWVV